MLVVQPVRPAVAERDWTTLPERGWMVLPQPGWMVLPQPGWMALTRAKWTAGLWVHWQAPARGLQVLAALRPLRESWTPPPGLQRPTAANSFANTQRPDLQQA